MSNRKHLAGVAIAVLRENDRGTYSVPTKGLYPFHPVEFIARDAGTYYAPVNEPMGARGGDALLPPDHVHPNDAGHAKIAEAFAGATLSTDRFLK